MHRNLRIEIDCDAVVNSKFFTSIISKFPVKYDQNLILWSKNDTRLKKYNQFNNGRIEISSITPEYKWEWFDIYYHELPLIKNHFSFKISSLSHFLNALYMYDSYLTYSKKPQKYRYKKK